MQLIALARAIAGGFHVLVNVSSLVQIVSLHCQLRITATITRGIQAVLSVEWQFTVWNGVIPGPFYHGILSLTVVYCGKPLSFSTRECAL